MALLHNTTFMMTEQTVQEFLDFMRELYLPALRGSDILSDIRLHRIQTHEGESDAVSFALHFRVDDQMSLMSFMTEIAVDSNAALVRHFGERVIGFSTTMEEVEL
ncbi:DUF4286 family protein [Porphyromonas sp. COT-239 OH1446]|uniref:DUF4286 family protein n=1 Tax=Porphyromonas sp. COT-239 OH1446 TaxID=1515613 RepID=UPI00052E1E74|nr:DUF4286 family protein [Porphyromonas sp. COT-239 OH1446]KGN69947.1 hypothetical protein HQ37_05465 [Porphyromonas sp. COT-239 OH1446]